MKSTRFLSILLAFAPVALSAQGGGTAGAARSLTPQDSVRLEARSREALAVLSAGRYDSAVVLFDRLLLERRAFDDSAGLGRTLNSLGASHYQMGQYEAALEAFLESLAYRRATGDQVGIARVLTNIGKSYHDWRQLDRALPVLEQAVALADSTGHPYVRAYALTCLGELLTDLGRLSEARVLLERSYDIYRVRSGGMSEDDSTSAWALNTPALARLSVREGRPDAALAPLRELLEVSTANGRTRSVARAHLDLAMTYRVLGDRSRAISSAERALTVARSIEQRAMILLALEALADLKEAAGDSRAALAHLRAYQALRDTVFDQAAAQRIAAVEGRAETQRLQLERSRQDQLIARQQLVGILGVAVLALASVLLVQLVRFNRQGREREELLARTNAELAHANEELRTAISEVRQLKGFIPICANCKRIRDDKGFWEAVETYIADRSDAMFSHSICTHCGPELYGDAWAEGRSAPDPGATH